MTGSQVRVLFAAPSINHLSKLRPRPAKATCVQARCAARVASWMMWYGGRCMDDGGAIASLALGVLGPSQCCDYCCGIDLFIFHSRQINPVNAPSSSEISTSRGIFHSCMAAAQRGSAITPASVVVVSRPGGKQSSSAVQVDGKGKVADATGGRSEPSAFALELPPAF